MLYEWITVLLIRHGQSTWNHQDRFTGSVDVPVTRKGLHQMQGAAAEARALLLPGQQLGCVYTSTLRRALRSAEHFCAELQYENQIIQDARLDERDYGDLTGIPKRWLREAVPAESFDLLLSHPPNGESYNATARRARAFWNDRILGSHSPGDAVAIVSSKNLIKCLVHDLSRQEGVCIRKPSAPAGAWTLSSPEELPYFHVDNGEVFVVRAHPPRPPQT